MKGQKVVVRYFQIWSLVAVLSNYKMLYEAELVQGEKERSKVVDEEQSGHPFENTTEEILWKCWENG